MPVLTVHVRRTELVGKYREVYFSHCFNTH